MRKWIGISFALLIVALGSFSLVTTQDVSSIDILARGRTAATSASDPLNVQHLEAEIIELTNRERLAHSLPPLKPIQKLVDCSRMHSEEMITKNFFGHKSLTAGRERPLDRVRAVGLQATAVGENLYECEGHKATEVPSKTVQAWMRSEGHRKNILRPDYQYVGVGVIAVEKRVMVTQVFSGPLED